MTSQGHGASGVAVSRARRSQEPVRSRRCDARSVSAEADADGAFDRGVGAVGPFEVQVTVGGSERRLGDDPRGRPVMAVGRVHQERVAQVHVTGPTGRVGERERVEVGKAPRELR